MKRNGKSFTVGYGRILVAVLAALALCLSPDYSDAKKKRMGVKPRPKTPKKQVIELEPAPAPDSAMLDLSLPKVESSETKNGLRILYIRNDLPQTVIAVTAGFGKLYESRNNAGISQLMAKALSLSGSKKYPGEKLHHTIEDAGGRLSIAESWEGTTLAVQVLDRYAGLAFDVLADMVMNPDFNDAHLAQAKALMAEEIRRKKDSPESIAFDRLREIIFSGAGYGANATETTVNAITLSDISAEWRSHFCAANLIVTVSGPKPFEEMMVQIEGRLAGLDRGERHFYRPDMEAITRTVRGNAGRVYLIPKSIPQATIVVGTVAPKISYEGNYALSTMNFILGEGSFNSRLMQEIRVKRGLSYAVQSVIKARRDTGVFLAYAQTKSEQADLALSLMVDNIIKMAQSRVNEEELSWAKKSIMRSYVFDFETPDRVLAQYSFLLYSGLPENYITDYRKKIDAVTADDILKESEGLFHDGLIKLVVGDESLKTRLAKFGQVVVIAP